MKTRAYLDPTGNTQVTAWTVKNERDLLHRGEPTGKLYYSVHTVGRRKLMVHVSKKGYSPHFKYHNGADEHSAGAGESLQHILFKEAVASISGTALNLGKYGTHRIIVTDWELEKPIDHPHSPRRADVFLRFTTESSLGLKWGGELYVEIKRTHAVEKAKLDIVRSLRLPMVEVPIPASILYEYNGEDTTDEREAAYLCRIKKMLEGPTGFLACEVLNNPSTLEYMEQQLPMMRRDLAKSETAKLAAETRVAELTERLASVERSAQAQTNELALANQRIVSSEEAAKNVKVDLDKLRATLKVANQKMGELQAQKNEWSFDGRWLVAALAVFALLVVIIDYFWI